MLIHFYHHTYIEEMNIANDCPPCFGTVNKNFKLNLIKLIFNSLVYRKM